MKVEKKAFLSAMKKALPGVEKGSSIIEGADTFTLTKQAIHSYNDSITVSSPFPFPDDIDGSIKSMDMFKLISKMPTDEIFIESNEKILKINSGEVEAEMVKVENNISEYIDSLGISKLEWKGLPSNFFDAVRLCKIPGNNAPQRGIFVEGNVMVSTDVSRINRHVLSDKMDRFWIDDPSVVELLKIEGLDHYCIAKAWAHFKSKDGTIFSCKRKDDSSYPTQNIQKILDDTIKGEGDIEKAILPKGIYTVVDRVSTLSNEMDGLPAIRMTIKKDCIEFFSERHAGKIREKLNLENPFKKEINIPLWVDPFFLTEVSKKASNFYVKSMERDEGKKINVLVFHNENYVQVASTFSGKE